MSPSKELKKAFKAYGLPQGMSLREFARHCDASNYTLVHAATTAAARAWIENKAKQRARSVERQANSGNTSVHAMPELRSCAPTSHYTAPRSSAARKASK